jgi:hypothetical protein
MTTTKKSKSVNLTSKQYNTVTKLVCEKIKSLEESITEWETQEDVLFTPESYKKYKKEYKDNKKEVKKLRALLIELYK